MSLQRPLSWNSALRGLYTDRVQIARGVLTARTLIEGLARMRRTALVTPTGSFDRAAIMASAVEAARAHQRRTGDAWGASMSVALKAAWAAARSSRAVTAH